MKFLSRASKGKTEPPDPVEHALALLRERHNQLSALVGRLISAHHKWLAYTGEEKSEEVFFPGYVEHGSLTRTEELIPITDELCFRWIKWASGSIQGVALTLPEREIARGMRSYWGEAEISSDEAQSVRIGFEVWEEEILHRLAWLREAVRPPVVEEETDQRERILAAAQSLG